MNTAKKTHLHSLLESNNDKLLTCVHCGLCLPSCPTYRVLGNENDSPRGRVYLMRARVEDKLPLGETFAKHIDLCLGCRACETACPSGVPYGHLLEAARAEIVEAHQESDAKTAPVARFVLRQIFMRPQLLKLAMKLTRWFRDSGLAELALQANLASGQLQFALAVLLASRSPFAKRQAKSTRDDLTKDSINKSLPENSPTSTATRVGVLRGCVMEGLFTETNRATERVLQRNRCAIVEADGQMCCGALHAHAGYMDEAKQLARKNIEVFLQSGCEAIVVNSAGCGAAMKEYKDWFEHDMEFAERAREFSAKVKDVSEFLIEQGVDIPDASLNLRVTYDAPCHLMHAQKIVSPPVDLLKMIPGLRFRTLSGAENCCGGAGIYNLQHPELSSEILSTKLDNIKATGAEIVATANPGCIMQIGAGARMTHLNVAVAHPIELLDAAYEAEKV
ncbi:MAG: heterodisulfide reductase-related iron-sulfur binding cluster [Acidobacteriota bacterium]